MVHDRENVADIYRRIFDARELYVFKALDMTVLTTFLPLRQGGKFLESVSKLQTQYFERMFRDFRTSLMTSLIKDNGIVSETNSKGNMFEERVSALEPNEVEQLLEGAIKKTKNIEKGERVG
jgi:hypothetical protein